MDRREKTNQGDRLISEADLLKNLSLKKQELDQLRREKGLPYIRLSRKSRAYLLSDVMNWAWKNRVVPDTVSEPD